MAGWRRLAPLRRGTASGAWPGGRSRSSSATWLAAVAGAAAISTAVTGAGWPLWLRAALAGWGAFVLVTGLAGRVTAVQVSDDELLVRRAFLRDRALPVDRILRVSPPRWPLGAWRVDGTAGSITLMPSDLRGAEAALATAVTEAGLRFRDGAWLREP